MKQFYERHGIGMAKYTVNFHDGEKTHNDGSDFFDIKIFKSQSAVTQFTKALLAEGYVRTSGYTK